MAEAILQPRAALNASPPEAAPFGRIGRNWSARPHRYTAGQVHSGHAHIVEHVTYLERGTISVQRSDRAAPDVYTAPMWIEMPADVWHEITAVTDAFWYCVFFDARPPWETAPFDAERG